MFVSMEEQLPHNLYKDYCILIRALTVGMPNYGKLDATNKA